MPAGEIEDTLATAAAALSLAASETSNATAADALADAAEAIALASSTDNKTHHPTPKTCHDVSMIFDHETAAAKDFCASFSSKLLCNDYCSNYCLTIVDSEEPCHPKVDADGDGVVDGKEEGVRQPAQKKGSPTIVFVIIVGLLAWASYHGTRNARSKVDHDRPLAWTKTTSSSDHDDRAEQGIAMVDYEETAGGSLMPRGYQRSSDTRPFL